MRGWPLLLLPLCAQAAPVFEPQTTQRALKQPEARTGALTLLLGLDRTERAQAREAGVSAACLSVATDERVPVADRVRAVRAVALLDSGQIEDSRAINPLVALAAQTQSPEQLAVAREAAIALRQLGALPALGALVRAPDPQIRATAAGAGAAPEALCALLANDAWPEVRAAAAQGLAYHAAHAACLEAGLKDREPKVQLAAAEAAAKQPVASLKTALLKLAGDPKAPVPARAEALVALSRLGERLPARKVLATQLEKGGIEGLAVGAVRALAFSDEAEDQERLLLALTCPVESVALAAARGVSSSGLPPSRALKALKTLRERLKGRPRAAVEHEISRMVGGVFIERDPELPDDPRAEEPDDEDLEGDGDGAEVGERL